MNKRNLPAVIHDKDESNLPAVIHDENDSDLSLAVRDVSGDTAPEIPYIKSHFYDFPFLLFIFLTVRPKQHPYPRVVHRKYLAGGAAAIALIVAAVLSVATVSFRHNQTIAEEPPTARKLIHLTELDGDIDESCVETMEYDINEKGNYPSLTDIAPHRDILGYVYLETGIGCAPKSADKLELDLDWYDEYERMNYVVTDHYINNEAYKKRFGNMSIEVNYIDRATGEQIFPSKLLTGYNYKDQVELEVLPKEGYVVEWASGNVIEDATVSMWLHIWPGAPDPYLNSVTFYYDTV